MSTQIETTERLLARLDLAIDEAKLVRAIIKTKNIVSNLEAKNPAPRNLMLLKHEIELLEAKLALVRRQANRG